jgi:phosphate uptake regulator
MREVRRRFHEELRALEGEVQRTGTQAQLLLEQALQALARRDVAVCEAVIRGDDEVDQLYLDTERRILGLFALQTRSRPTCGCSRPCCTSTCIWSALPIRR